MTQQHYFPGANTYKGFFSCFDHIQPLDTARYVYIIKGGSGVGKSTFMRKVAAHIESAGERVEYFHCSSDPDSLDGVAFPELRVALLDGTAPHTVDPRLPGAADGIINLGMFLNEEELYSHKAELAARMKERSECFTRAYHYLAAAQRLRDDAAHLFRLHTDMDALHRLSDAWAAELLREYAHIEGCVCRFRAAEPGRERILFASAIAPGGTVDFLSTLSANVVLNVDAPWGAPAEIPIRTIADAFIRAGISVETLRSPLEPDRIEHVRVPSLNIMLTSPSEYVSSPLTAQRELTLFDVMDTYALSAVSEQIRWDNDMFNALITRATQALADAKRIHVGIEALYSRCMSFDMVSGVLEKVIGALDAYRAAMALGHAI